MENIKTAIKGNKLTIEIDLKEKGRPSGSGKTQVIASTNGNISIDGAPEMKLGLNLYTKPAK